MAQFRVVLHLLAMICIMMTGLESHAQSKYHMRFGVNGGMYPGINKGEEEIISITEELDELGMIWLRHPGQDTAWFEVQPARDIWDFRKLDAVINHNDHPWLIEIYGSIGTAYPFEGDFSKQHLESLGGKNEIMQYIIDHAVDMNDPQQKADAELYVKTFVTRYKDKIKYWEIGNEGIQASEAFGIITNTYQWIKEAHPDSVVVITAVAGDDDSLFDRGLEAFDSLLKKGIADYFDVGNIHYYGRIEGDFEERLGRRFEQYKQIMAKYGVQKPIWVTETSTSSHERSVLSGPSSEQIQARHVVKRLVIFSAKGAEKVFWHDYRETYEDNAFYQCNLVDPDTYIPKPAYYTFKLAVEKLGFYKDVVTLRDDDVRLYKFITHEDRPVFVAWSSLPQDIDLSAHCTAEKVLVTHIVEDSNSQLQIRAAQNTNIKLSESPVFIEPALTLGQLPPWDVNGDGAVNIVDLVIVGLNFGKDITAPATPNPDVNRDGEVNMLDVVLVGQHFGEVYLPTETRAVWTVDH